MRHLFFLLALLSCLTTYTQTFTVGSTCCNYFVTNKTFTTPTTYGFYSDYFYLDIDGDSNNDIVIRSQHYSCQPTPSGPCTGQWGNDITITLANSVSFVYGPATPSCSVLNTIKNLTYGTSLNSSLNWSVTSAPNSGPIIFSAGVGYSCGQSVNPFYVGFRKILPLNDTIYGWIRLDSNFPGKVIDYGYQKTSSATNVASLSSKILDVIDVYPNPVNDKVSISIDDFSNSNQYRIKLISIEGKELKSVEITHSKTEISLSDLSNGIYFVEIGHGKILARRKLIVIH